MGTPQLEEPEMAAAVEMAGETVATMMVVRSSRGAHRGKRGLMKMAVGEIAKAATPHAVAIQELPTIVMVTTRKMRSPVEEVQEDDVETMMTIVGGSQQHLVVMSLRLMSNQLQMTMMMIFSQ